MKCRRNLDEAVRVVGAVSAPIRSGEYRSLLIFLACTATVVTAALSVLQSGPDPSVLVPLFVLVLVATHREAFFSDETAINGSIVVVCASFVPFRSNAAILGPVICGLAAGIHWAHLRERVWSKLIVNTAATGLAAAVGAGTFALLTDVHPSVPAAALAVPPSVLAYWVVNNTIIAMALKIAIGNGLVSRLHDLLRAESGMVLFGTCGGLCGLLIRSSEPGFGIAAVVAVLVVVDIRVLSMKALVATRTHERVSQALRALTVLISSACLGVLIAARLGVVGAVCAVLASVLLITFVVALVRVHRATGIWDRHLAFGMAVVDAPLPAVFALAGVLAEVAGIWVGAAGLGIALALTHVVSRRLRRHQIRVSADDHRIAAALERAVVEGRSLPTSSH